MAKPAEIRQKYMDEYNVYEESPGLFVIKSNRKLEGNPLFVAYFFDEVKESFLAAKKDSVYLNDPDMERHGLHSSLIQEKDIEIWPEIGDYLGAWIGLFIKDRTDEKKERVVGYTFFIKSQERAYTCLILTHDWPEIEKRFIGMPQPFDWRIHARPTDKKSLHLLRLLQEELKHDPYEIRI